MDKSVWQIDHSAGNKKTKAYENTTKRYKVKELTNSFMNNENIKSLIDATVERIQKAINDENDVNKAGKELMNLLYTEMQNQLHEIKPNTSKKNMKLNQKPWWNDELQDLWDEQCTNERAFLKATSKSHHKQQLRSQFIQSRKSFDRALRRVKRRYQRAQQEKLGDLCDNDSVGFWKMVKNMSVGAQRTASIPLSVEIENEVTSDLDVVMQKWKSDFETLFSPPNSAHFDANHLQIIERRLLHIQTLQDALPIPDEPIHTLNVPLTFQEVDKAIRNLKNAKACGLDGVFSECLKNKSVIDLLFRIYCYCFEHGVVPDSWLLNVINPIFKAGSLYDPLNYRGITLVNIVCKCYSFILNTRLCKWAEDNGILSDEQNGFRHARSCLDHMYVLYTIVKNRIMLKRSTYACFIDAKKAFDRVNHACLWVKLYDLGIKGKMLSAIQSLYDKDRLSCKIRLNNLLTDSFPVLCGVKQGDPMSPTLFALYVNDLIDELNIIDKGVQCGKKKVCSLFYADDIVILAENAADLQMQLDKVNQWCSKWRMELNQDKTKIIHFRPKTAKITSYKFTCGSIDLNSCSKYKYLGMYFNEFMDDCEIVKDVAKSASRALGGVICKFKNTGGLHYGTFTKLYECIVQPVMLYGAGLWGNKEFSKLNTIQNRACKYFLGLPKTASNVACEGDIGWLSVYSKQKLEMLRLWCRLKNMDKERLTSCIFNWSLSLSKRNIKTWEYNVKKNLKDAIMSYCITDGEVNCKFAVYLYKQYLNKHDNDKWSTKLWDDRNNLQNGNKLRLYRCYKSKIMVETYVTNLMSFSERQCLAKLRSGSLPLEVELGRRSGTPIGERTCKLCSENKIEDEVHFLLECELYDDLREVLITDLNESDSDLNAKDQYCLLMSNPDIQADISKCVFKMWERRKLFYPI